MYQPITLCIGFRFFFETTNNKLDKIISYFSIISITLGVMALIIVLSIMNGCEKELEKKLLTVTAHVLLTSQIGNINSQQQNEKESFLKNLKDVAQLTKIIITNNSILQNSKNISTGTIYGINPTDFEPLSKFVIYGSITQLVSKKYYAILGSTLAQQLKIQIGDNIRIILPNVIKITPIGNIPSQRLFKVIGIFVTNTDIDRYQLLINQEDAARLMQYPSGHITGWRLWLKKPLKIDYFKKQKLPSELNSIDWRERQNHIFQAIKIEKKMMSLLLNSIIIISGFNIISLSSLLVTDRKKEIAILKTQGFSNKQIFFLFSIQGTSIGIIGTILGTLFGCLITKKINWMTSILKFFTDESILPTQINLEQMIIITIVTISMSFLATLYPAKIATTIKPSEILQNE